LYKDEGKEEGEVASNAESDEKMSNKLESMLLSAN